MVRQSEYPRHHRALSGALPEAIFTREELQAGRPVIGIANTGSDLTPCNKIHVFLMDRINNPALAIYGDCILFIRNVGCVGYPGSAEVVNMQPPDAPIRQGVNHLPTVGDGRQSGTSESASILNAAPEAVVDGGLALLRTGDRVRLDLTAGRMHALMSEEDWAPRAAAWIAPPLQHQTSWQEIYRRNVGQLATGGCLEMATAYQRIARTLPRHAEMTGLGRPRCHPCLSDEAQQQIVQELWSVSRFGVQDRQGFCRELQAMSHPRHIGSGRPFI